MIQKLEVKRLNNRDDGDHDLSFHHDLNIFTGANGSGKTTLLKLIWYLISGNLERVFVEIPFRSVSIWADPFSLSVTRLNSDKVQFVSRENVFSKSVDFTITVSSKTGKLEKHEDAEKLNELNFDIVDAMKSSLFFPTFRRIEGGFSTSPMPDRYVTPNLRFTESAYSYRTPTMLQEAISELADVVSVNEHKFIASISTDDISELLKQKRINISKNIDEFQAELLQEITQKTEKYFSSERKSGTKESKQARSVLDNIQKRVDQVTTKRKTLLKPFSVLSDLARSILRYQSIHITEQVAHGDGTEGITLDDDTDFIYTKYPDKEFLLDEDRGET